MAPRVTFMSLPGELRNRIYDLAGLVHHTRIRVSNPPYTKGVKEPTIALANRQIRSEVLGIFYGQNILTCGTRDDLKNFLQRQPPSTLRALRSIQWGSTGTRTVLSRIRRVLTVDMRPFINNGLGADVVAAAVQVKDEGRIFVTASEIGNFKQNGTGVSRSEIIRVKHS